MNNQLNLFISIEPDFFQELEGEFGGKITGKLANFLRTVEIVRPDRFMTSEMKWCGIGRKKLDREKFFRAFLLKAEFNLPTTKVLIESLRTNTSWRLLCGWEYSSKIPSEATFSRAFSEFAKAELPSAVHEEIVVENCHDELIGHASKDSTAIEVREKPCRRKRRTCKTKKKRGRKSKAEKAALQAKKEEEIRTRRLALQPFQNDAGKAQFFCKGESGRIMEPHLSGTVKRQFWEIFAGDPCDAQILNDHGVGTQTLQQRKFMSRFVKFIFLDKGIERDIDLSSELVRIGDQTRHFLMGKILGPFAGIEALQPAVHGIRPGIECRQSTFQIPRRRQQFHIQIHPMTRLISGSSASAQIR